MTSVISLARRGNSLLDENYTLSLSFKDQA
jgi:hypothetical protein